MNPLSRIAGTAVDRAMGLAPAAAPYVVRPNAPVPMPDGVALSRTLGGAPPRTCSRPRRGLGLPGNRVALDHHRFSAVCAKKQW
jgi:hypothetical protein